MGKLFQGMVLGLGLAVSLGGCGDRLSDAQSRIAASTRSPGTVTFRNVRIVGGQICGEMTTASGASAGFTPFLAEENDYGVIYPEFPPDARARSVDALRDLLIRDREGCVAAATLRQELGVSGPAPQCLTAAVDKRAYVALKIYAARFRRCSGVALPGTGLRV
jgi:hypothetical protein